ncbi:MAG: sodium:proton antiporter [Chloroflexi bacterium]|nr:sodium:proton antiporter [Chloroflexota bacterium]
MTLPDWVLLCSGLLVVAVLLDIAARRLHVPFTVALAVGGFVAATIGGVFDTSSPLRGEQFEAVVVFLFLPLLVMEAALGLSTRDFFANLVPILVLAILALAVSAGVVGVVIAVGLDIPLTAALLFGVLIAATDPVAVVAIFRELGVPRRLLTLMEGESLLNDGVAIVLYAILLAAAQGESISIMAGSIDFLSVFFGGIGVGVAVGGLAAIALPWLTRLPAAALSIAVAYGGFVLADHVLGFSGVMATVAAGLVLGGLAPSSASEAIRATWHEVWEALGHVANALLFLLIGLAIDATLVADHLGAIVLAIIAVLIARAVAVFPLVSVLERLTGIPPVGRRNEMVLIWGGLRGGVALALALALPEELPERDLFVALTGGVVLATLLVNATTIGVLVRRLGLDRSSRGDRFLAASAQLSGVEAARGRLAELSLGDPTVSAELDTAAREAQAELERINLSSEEEQGVIARRGLLVERQTYQHLSDARFLPPATTRALLHEVDGMIEEATLRSTMLGEMQRELPRLERLAQRVTAWLPTPVGADADELAYAEATARRLAAQRCIEALSLFSNLPNVTTEAVVGAKAVFQRWEEAAVDSLDDAFPDTDPAVEDLRRRVAATLGTTAAEDALADLVSVGVLSERAARVAVESIREDVYDDRHGAE